MMIEIVNVVAMVVGYLIIGFCLGVGLILLLRKILSSLEEKKSNDKG